MRRILRRRMPMSSILRNSDPEVAATIERELDRQRNNLILIASENYASIAILEAQGTIFTNKYAEGYPGMRWYHGCEHADEVESLAIERVKALFHAEHANVQPHAGATANLAAYMAVLKPGDTILAMSVDQGGHLTHGGRSNYSSRFYNVVPYGVSRETETIDLDQVRELALEHRPQLIVVGASAYPRAIEFGPWREIANEVGAYLMADMAHVAGLVAADVHPDPVPYCDITTSTTHKTLRGPRGAFILCKREHARAVDAAVFPGCQGGPLVHVTAAKAVCFREAGTTEFRDYARQVVRNCKALAQALSDAGLRLLSGGTDNHLLVVDVRPVGLFGQQATDILRQCNIIANKNLIPYDTGTARNPGGVRLGTAAVTTRGMKEEEMRQVGSTIAALFRSPSDQSMVQKARALVADLCARFPLYPEL